MSTERIIPAFYAFGGHQENRPLHCAGLKRKFDSVFHFGQGQLCNPSPPMSRQPSPPPPGPELFHAPVNETGNFPTESSGTASLTSTDLTASRELYSAAALPPPLPPHEGPLTHHSSLSTPLAGIESDHASALGVSHAEINLSRGPPAFATSLGVGGQSSPRSGRKSKAHVASACINCKRAHLSCDVQRPCARCVASGKQDTCFDVQHKKRGRPRLREESDFKIEQMLPEQPERLSLSTASAQIGSRPIATPRHRRADSLRSLRSQVGEGSSLPPPNFLPPPVSFQSPLVSQQPIHSGTGLTPAEVPTAFLDVDLVFLRANRPFQQIMNDGQEIRGYHLGDIAAAADNESFNAIRNRLRTEREEREPAYMPPIVQSGLDLIQGVSESDVERLTHGFTDHSYTWTRSRAAQGAETFPARVRLAKAIAYFVVITLPSFRPVTPFAAPQLSPISARLTQPVDAHRQPFSSSIQPQLTQSSPDAQSYLPSQRGTPQQQPMLPSTPQLPIVEPPVDTTPFQPRSTGRELTQYPTPGVQLAPIGSSPVMVSEAMGSRRTEGAVQHVSSSEEEDNDRSPKRRRMGIPDVLQP